MGTDGLNLPALVAYWLLSPTLAAWLVARLTAPRVLREGARAATGRWSRWFIVPWLWYLGNVVVGAALLGERIGRPSGAGVLALAVVALLPILLVLLVTQRWGRAIGHPGGNVTLAVQVRGWLVNTVFFSLMLALAPLAATASPLLGWGLGATLAAVYLTFYPELFCWIWKTYPLPETAAGARIRALLATQDAPVRGILVIPRALGATPNAFASGLFDRRRYLFVTEPLLEDFPPEEVDAVVAHEIGHLLHRHVGRTTLVNVGALVAATVVLTGLIALLRGVLGEGARHAMQAVIGAASVMVALRFTRATMRRFEFEADDFAARTLGSGAPMAHALRRLARQNWLAETGTRAGAMASHPTIESRIRRLLDADTNGGTPPPAPV